MRSMVTAALSAFCFLTLQSAGFSHEATSSPSCLFPEDGSSEDCGASETGALLLQVGEFRHEKSSKSAKVTMEDVKRQTKPLSSRLEAVEERVTALETAVEKLKDEDGSTPDEDEKSKENESEDNEEEEEKKDEKKSDKSNSNENEEGGRSKSNENEEDKKSNSNENEEDETSNSNENEDNEKSNSNESEENEEDEKAADWAWGGGNGNKQHHRHLEDRSVEADPNAPDWDGVAPSPHWNGLEDVKAKDSGPEASWKGKGTGVSSGKHYKGKYPYEIMMDVDFLIDSNPAAPKSPAKSSPTSGGKTSPRASPRSSPTSGGKSNAKAPSRSGKSGKTSGGKSSPRLSEVRRRNRRPTNFVKKVMSEAKSPAKPGKSSSSLRF